MSQQNLNKIYSQVRDTEYVLSSSSPEIQQQGGYSLTKYDSGKTFILENDGNPGASPSEQLLFALPENPSSDLLGWNAKFIMVSSSKTTVFQQAVKLGNIDFSTGTGVGTVFTGSITSGAGNPSWSFTHVGVSGGFLSWGGTNCPPNGTLEVVCTEAGPTAAECTFVFRATS